MATSPKTRSVTIPPPVLGWNTKDPISEMDPLYSPGIVNYIPANGTVDMRKGYTQHVKTNVTLGYLKLVEYITAAGVRNLIGFTVGAGRTYNVTVAGTGTEILLGGVSTNEGSVFSAVNYAGRLFFKGYNPARSVLSTDGTTATAPGFVGPAGDDLDLWAMCVYKGRLYALEISGTSMWYTGTIGAVTGALTEWDFQSLLTLGGQPWFIGTFSMTGGDVTQEYFLVISQAGECLLYQGDYPGDSTWYLVGRYFIPAPVGLQAFFNWGSDVIVITYDGLVSMQEVIRGGGDEYTFLTDNISSAFKDAVAAANSTSLITGIVYPKGQYLLINFYITTGVIQFVMNTRTRAWTKFTNQEAICWSLLENNLYWGGVSTDATTQCYVAKADDGYRDCNTTDSALTLSRATSLRFAFNYLGSRDRVKIPTQAVPILYESEGLSLTIDCDIDYSDTAATSTNTNTADTSYKLYKPTCGLTAPGPGKAVSIRLDGSVTTKRRSIQAVEVFYKEGDLR